MSALLVLVMAFVVLSVERTASHQSQVQGWIHGVQIVKKEHDGMLEVNVDHGLTKEWYVYCLVVWQKETLICAANCYHSSDFRSIRFIIKVKVLINMITDI